nr:MAG TPA: Protein of unknown function (DUF1642) [Caudoviricetes sp.]
MTKFEEEVKRPANGPLTELNNNMQEVFSQYRKMRQYADYLEYELKQKDEHILKVENENSFMRDERTTFDSNGMAVEPKLQQQALPVVPKFVAVQIERVKNSNGNFATLGLFDWNHEAKPDYTKWIHENVFDFMRACTIGYTVEKPQLFYLKNKLTTSYLALDTNTGYYEHWGEEIIPKLLNKQGYKISFTQQEIGSMQTGSYELVPVEDGE